MSFSAHQEELNHLLDQPYLEQDISTLVTDDHFRGSFSRHTFHDDAGGKPGDLRYTSNSALFLLQSSSPIALQTRVPSAKSHPKTTTKASSSTTLAVNRKRKSTDSVWIKKGEVEKEELRRRQQRRQQQQQQHRQHCQQEAAEHGFVGPSSSSKQIMPQLANDHSASTFTSTWLKQARAKLHSIDPAPSVSENKSFLQIAPFSGLHLESSPQAMMMASPSFSQLHPPSRTAVPLALDQNQVHCPSSSPNQEHTQSKAKSNIVNTAPGPKRKRNENQDQKNRRLSRNRIISMRWRENRKIRMETLEEENRQLKETQIRLKNQIEEMKNRISQLEASQSS